MWGSFSIDKDIHEGTLDPRFVGILACKIIRRVRRGWVIRIIYPESFEHLFPRLKEHYYSVLLRDPEGLAKDFAADILANVMKNAEEEHRIECLRGERQAACIEGFKPDVL